MINVEVLDEVRYYPACAPYPINPFTFCPQVLCLLMTAVMDSDDTGLMGGKNQVNVRAGSGLIRLKCLSLSVNENSISPDAQFSLCSRVLHSC